MDASIGEPFLLASYAVAQRLKKSKATAKAPQRAGASVSATHGKIASGSSDGYVTVTAQGDGVHVLDLSTLHPVASHTLGPSTSFSCASVSLSVLEGDQNICATYAAIASAADVTLDDCGRTLWVWRENLSSAIGDRASQKKKAAVMPHPISEIYACNGVPPRLLVLSPAGDLTVVDADLKIRSTLPPSPSSAVLQSFVFHRDSSCFLSGPPGSTAVVLLEHSQEAETSIRILDISTDDEAREVGSARIPVKSDQIACASCSASGYLSILTRDGFWNSFQIDSKADAINVYSAAQPLRLKALSFIGKSAEASPGSETATVALNTSLVLLAAITSSPRNIVLLVWDLQYSVLLASHILAVPAPLAHLPTLAMTLRLVAAAAPQALLILAPPSADAQKSTTRASVLVVPLALPRASTISNAMGRAGAGAPWLVQPSAADAFGPARAKVLAAVQAALAAGQPDAAEAAFFAWEKSAGEDKDGDDESGEEAPQAALGHSFVRELLVAALQPARPAGASYPAVLVRSLLERRVVSAGMVDGGLLAALKLRDDWSAIELCTTHVADLAESDLMSILQFVAAHDRMTGGAAAADAMEVDTAVPALPAFLSACVRYPGAPAARRSALHTHLGQAEDAVAVLEVLDAWLARLRGAEVLALPPKRSVGKDAHGVCVLKAGWRKDELGAADACPPLGQVLVFLQTLLDAAFLALLQHAPAHGVLRRVLARIEPEIRLTEQVEMLRGPLEVFARAQAKAVREGREGKKEGATGGSGGAWRMSAAQWRLNIKLSRIANGATTFDMGPQRLGFRGASLIS
ncbi:hypothetical protein B0H17DRAFT_1327195 [Mycena rosella]|uniref:Uncharacterized protein n=1 Tax=Mycena rosella TaxID=1033263 RepID=A0AAD7E0Q3_MYCRO|nr:hypothetical protein B0H17DRAFT_1327195 [Mycena rosella]